MSAGLHFLPKLPPQISPDSNGQNPGKSTCLGSWGHKLCIHPLFSCGAHKAGPLCAQVHQRELRGQIYGLRSQLSNALIHSSNGAVSGEISHSRGSQFWLGGRLVWGLWEGGRGK
jgi:hypothetical protein